MFAPLEKCTGHNLKLLDIVQKIWAPLRKLFQPLMVSQAGYGHGFNIMAVFLHDVMVSENDVLEAG